MSKWLGVLGYLLFCLPSWGAGENTSTTVEPSIRALHFVLRGVSAERAHWIVDEARQAKFNTIIVLVTDGVTLRNSPWSTKAGAWSRDEFKKWVTYAQTKGIQVIPELNLLTHQEKFLQDGHPDMMFNSATYNPNNPEVYRKYVYPLIDELVELFSPRAIHIGHDELVGWVLHKSRHEKHIGLLAREQMLPAELFLKDVLLIRNHLAERNVETWMWGDMLISPDEFPEMLGRELHGISSGYGKALRQKLPKDIVICDWHYADDQMEYPSLAAFKAEGFRVLGATWKKEKTIRNFSRYAAEQGADGMIATTWFHVQRKEWDVVGNIIKTSGRAFNKDFPDAQ